MIRIKVDSFCDLGPCEGWFDRWVKDSPCFDATTRELVYPEPFDLAALAKRAPGAVVWLAAKKLIPVSVADAMAAVSSR
jgi:hypothetical protein